MTFDIQSMSNMFNDPELLDFLSSQVKGFNLESNLPPPPPPLQPSSTNLLDDDLVREYKDLSDMSEIDLDTPLAVERDPELELLIQYLMVTTPTVVIKGDTGTDKMSLVRELARQIAKGSTPSYLKECKIIPISASTPLEAVTKLHKNLGKKVIFVFNGLEELRSSDQAKWRQFALSGARLICICHTLPENVKVFWQDLWNEVRLKPYTLEISTEILSNGQLEEQLSKRVGYTVKIERAAVEFALRVASAIVSQKPLLEGASFLLECAVIHHYMTSQNNDQGKTFSQNDIQNDLINHRNVPEHRIKKILAQFERLSQSQILPHESLARHTHNLTFSEDSFESALARDEELQAISQILASQESNNVLLVGPPGCGKSRIGEALVNGIRKGLYPALKGYEVLEPKAEFFSKDYVFNDTIESIKEAVRQGKKIILLIDEIHRLAFRCNPNTLPKIEELKEALGKGSLRILGMTTTEESESLLSDGATERRFTVRPVRPLTFEQITFVLQHKLSTISKKPKEELNLEMLANIVHLSKAYPSFNKEKGAPIQPAAALKLLDIIYSFYSTKYPDLPPLTTDLIIEAIASLEILSEDKIRKKLRRLQTKHAPSERDIPRTIYNYCSSWTADALNGKIVFLNVREAYLDEVCAVLNHKNCNNVLLFGVPGVGKTTLIKHLACQLVSNPELFPVTLRHKPLLALETSKIIEQPERFYDFLERIQLIQGRCILFIDEIHHLFAINPLTESPYINSLLPHLAEGLTLIGATTASNLNFDQLSDELQSRFSRITLPISPRYELYEMLQTKLQDLKKQHADLVVTDEVLYEMIDYPGLIQTPRNLIKILENAVDTAVQRHGNELGPITVGSQDVSIPSGQIRSRMERLQSKLPIIIMPSFLTSYLPTDLLQTITKTAQYLILSEILRGAVLRAIPVIRTRLLKAFNKL